MSRPGVGALRNLLLASLVLFAGSVCASEFTPPDKAKALEAVKKNVMEAAKSGKKVSVWLTLLGTFQKVELVKADDKAVTVLMQNNPFPQSWAKISDEQVAGVAKNCVLGEAQRALDLADFCMAAGLREKADEALELAAQASQTLGPQLAMRYKFLKTMPGAPPSVAAPSGAAPAPAAPAAPSNVAAIAAAAAGIGSGTPSAAAAGPNLTPYAPPAKLDYKGSEGGKAAPIATVAAAVDNAVEIDLAEMGVRPEKVCDDATFLRRVCLDLTGQIPSPEEVISFYQDGSANKRAKKIEELMERPAYAENWATFWNVILVGRRTRDNDDVKIAPLKNWLREQFGKNVPFDQTVREILTATGDNDKVGPVNYLTFHMADNLPNTVAHMSQTFLGARIGCAQCHDHPFDKWTQQDFWGFSAFLANTRSDRREERNDPADPTRVTKTWHMLSDQDQRNGGGRYDPPQNDLRLPPKVLDGPVFKAVPRATAAKADEKKDDKKAAKKLDAKNLGPADAKSADMKKDMKDMKGMAGMDGMAGGMGMMGGTQASADGQAGHQYRVALANWVTDPANEKFGQSAVNRLWRNMFGYGLVEPVDDIRPKNEASHPEVMKILAADFNSTGRDWKRLCAIITSTRAYQRASMGDASKIDRAKSVRYAARAEVRPMTPEMLFMAITKATRGQEAADNIVSNLKSRDEAMMAGNMAAMQNPGMGNYMEMMQRFINTSTAEDRAGKLQFEGTVGQALMMMHSDYINNAIIEGVKRFDKKGLGLDGMTYIFCATLGRPPMPMEAEAFQKYNSKGGLKGIMWILLNSSEFVTIH